MRKHTRMKKADTDLRPQVRMSPEQMVALDMLATKLNISGQRGATFQPFILWLADKAIASMSEMVAALEPLGVQAAKIRKN